MWRGWRLNIATRLRGISRVAKVIGIVIGIMVLAASFSYAAHAPRSGGIAASSSQSSSTSMSAGTTTSATSGATEASGSAAADSGASYAAPSVAPSTKFAVSTGASGRLVIKTANIDLSSAHLSDTANAITQITSATGGYVQSIQSSTPSQGQDFESMTVRVPESQFQGVIIKIHSLGTVRSFTQSGQDVTSNHNNLQAQISELQSEAKAYTELFGKAAKMSDMLQIQQALSQVNSQVSNLNQQLHQLDGSVQYATINVSLYPSATVIPKTPQPFWMAAVNSFHFMMRVGFDLLSALAWLLPWVVPVGVIWFIVHLIRRNNHQKAQLK